MRFCVKWLKCNYNKYFTLVYHQPCRLLVTDWSNVSHVYKCMTTLNRKDSILFYEAHSHVSDVLSSQRSTGASLGEDHMFLAQQNSIGAPEKHTQHVFLCPTDSLLQVTSFQLAEAKTLTPEHTCKTHVNTTEEADTHVRA